MQNLMQVMATLQNSGNPMGMLMQMAGSDPRMARAVQMAQQGDPKQVFFNLASQHGMNEAQARQFAAQMGINI